MDSILIDELDTDFGHSRVVIVGVTSYLGYHLSVSISNQNFTLMLIEDKEVEHTFDSTIIERIRKLEKTQIKFMDFGDKSKLLDLIENFNPDVIVYIPTALFAYQKAKTKNRYFTILDFSRELKLFFNILTNIESVSHRARPHVILVSISSSEVLSPTRVWFNSHERLLSRLMKLNVVQSSIFRVQKSHDESTHTSNTGEHLLNVNNVAVNAIGKVIKSSKNIFIDLGCSDCALKGFTKLHLNSLTGKVKTDQPLHTDTVKGPLAHGKDVVMTTYFTNVKNPMHSVGYATNKFRFMRSWFLSAKRLGLHMVVFHDNISDDFQRRVKDYYPHIDFIKASSAGASPNDKRFQIFADYITSHQEVQNILLADIRDVTLGHNPFEIMTQIGDYIYVGQDLPFFFSTSSYGFVLNKVSRCYGKEAQGEPVKLYTLFNAGVLGGSRSAMLTTLQLINEYLHKAPSSVNCNMPALEIVLHKHLYEQTFSGYPFNNLFGVLYGGSQGVAVMHKTGHRIYP